MALPDAREVSSLPDNLHQFVACRLALRGQNSAACLYLNLNVYIVYAMQYIYIYMIDAHLNSQNEAKHSAAC